MAWSLFGCSLVQRERLNRYLAEDWEPFAVDGDIIWLRREAEPGAAGLVEERPRPGEVAEHW